MMLRFGLILMGAGIAASAAASPAPAPSVTVLQQPAFVAIVKEMAGDYSQHALATRQLLVAARAACGDGQGVLFGVYPQDPDAVPVERLRWQLALRISSAAKCARARLAGLALTSHPPETTAIVETTLAESKQVGLSLFGWLATSGYAQTGPVRMEYSGDGGPATAVRIVMPVRKRTWARQ